MRGLSGKAGGSDMALGTAAGWADASGDCKRGGFPGACDGGAGRSSVGRGPDVPDLGFDFRF